MTIAYDISREIRNGLPKPSRTMAPMRWFGGKGNMVKKILPLLPKGRLYCEPFCGAASIFWSLPDPYPIEVLNDLDGRLVNLFRVLQDPDKFERLAHRITWTPYARSELARAIDIRDSGEGDDIDRAWAFMVCANFGFSGSQPARPSEWSRSVTTISRCMADPANRWRCRMRLLDWWHDRLSRVQIEQRDAIEAIEYWDTDETVFYIDPPYIAETREKTSRTVYAHEMSDDDHERLVDTLLGIKGAAVVSGYAHDIYSRLDEAGWRRIEFRTGCHASGKTRTSKILGTGSAMKKSPRTEVVWVSTLSADGVLFAGNNHSELEGKNNGSDH